MKYIIFLMVLFLLSPIYSQICQDTESDTFYVIEARASLRYDLNDYNLSNKSWPDSVLNNFLSQAAWELGPEKRDTIKTTTAQFYSLNTDFMDIRGVMVKNDSRWTSLLRPDSSGAGALVKLDTIVTTINTIMYTLNNDFISDLGVLIKRSERWGALYQTSLRGPDGSGLFGRSGDTKIINSYSVAGKRLFLDSPPPKNGDTLLVVYTAFEYFVSDKRLIINAPVSGDSIVVFYSAYPNNFTSDSVIVNIPFKYRSQLIERAYGLAIRANTH